MNECFIEAPHLVDCLFDYLINCRYGLKEIEILDLLYLSALDLISIFKSNNVVVANTTSNSKLIFNYTMNSASSSGEINIDNFRLFTSLIWYTFKYNFFLQHKHNLLLFENYIHNNQLYYCFYDLNIKRKFHHYLISNQANNNYQESPIIDKRRIIYNYFNLNVNEAYIQKLNSPRENTSPNKELIKLVKSGSGGSTQVVRKPSYNVLNELRAVCISLEDDLLVKLNEIVYNRILLLLQPSATLVVENKQTNLIVYRMHQEVNLHYFNFYKFECKLNSTAIQQNSNNNRKLILNEQQLKFLDDYLKNFLLNFDWFINKVKETHVWFYVDDLEYYKHQLQQLSHFTETNARLKQLKDEFKMFEKCFYKIIYALNNDIDQVYVQFYQALHLFDIYRHLNDKYLKINQFFIKLKQHYESSHLLYPILKAPSSGGGEDSNENIFTFNEITSIFDDKKCIVSFVSFIKNLESYVISFSKTKNEIKIWNVKNLKIVRSIKLDMPPKDIRFIDSYKCVLLIERKLHLFDLNKCEHLNDLKTTMDKNMPFFELHNENILVYLNRNRLSVTMTKLPTKNEDNAARQLETQESISGGGGGVISQKVATKPTKHQNQFKAGEDRFMNSLLVSKNGKVMICGDETQKPFPLIVWNLYEQKLIHDFRWQGHEFLTNIQSVTTSGKYLICACKV